MSRTVISVWGEDGLWRWDVSEWDALVILGSIAAEPVTCDELRAAVARYDPRPDWAERGRPCSGLDEVEARGCRWCLIDLRGRTVVFGGGFKRPRHAVYEADAGDEPNGFPLVWIMYPDDWYVCEQNDVRWRRRVELRARRASRRPGLDTRRVLYGDPLLAHLAAAALAADKVSRDPYRQLPLTRRAHRDWMMTARHDLADQTPRQVLVARRRHIDRDLEARAEQWARQGAAAPGLDVNAHAYRYGGYGTAEICFYFDLVRELMSSAWQQRLDAPGIPRADLVERLRDRRDEWLELPYEGGATTPREFIEAERRRLPMTSDGSHLDCDCPICQLEADGAFGPTFHNFDGLHLEMEDDFAFSLVATHEEWLEEQSLSGAWDESGEEDDDGGTDGASDRSPGGRAERAAPEAHAAVRLADPATPSTTVRNGRNEMDDPTRSVWQSSYVNWDQILLPDVPSQARTLAIGFRVAELVSLLKSQKGGRPLWTALNEAYRNLHTAPSRESQCAASEVFCRHLESIAASFPKLTPQCADLQSTLEEIRRVDRP